jgi:probable rRNA maturation factor
MSRKQHSNVNFFHDYRSLPFPRKHLQKTADEMIKREKIIINKTVNVILCSNYKIRKLNHKFRNIDRATDVLSFFFGDEDLLGEIYISLQKAAVQSKQYNIPYADEVRQLFIHGFLHLLGYNHKTKKEQEIMKAHEQLYY